MGRGFGREKWALLIIKSGKGLVAEEIDLPNQERIRMLGEKETYNQFEILEADTIKQVEMKEKMKNKYFRRTRITKFYSRNLIKGINI